MHKLYMHHGVALLYIYIYIPRPKCGSCHRATMVIAVRAHCNPLDIYIYIYIQRITMCPHGYHHSGSMATPALGTRDVRLHIVWIALWSHQSAQTASSERCIVQKVNVPQGGSPPNPRECSNCTGSERNIQRITMCPHGYHHIYIYTHKDSRS